MSLALFRRENMAETGSLGRSHIVSSIANNSGVH